MLKSNEDGSATTMMGHQMQGEMGVFQLLPKLYMSNGGIYATKRNVLMKENILISKNTQIVIMSREHSFDIDEPIDFLVAEFLGRELGL